MNLFRDSSHTQLGVDRTTATHGDVGRLTSRCRSRRVRGAGRRSGNRVLAVMFATLASAQASCAGAETEPIFNGRDLAGWHVSATNHHGQTRAWRVEDGVLVGGQE